MVPAGPDWLHEIKYDGYRLIVEREGKRVWLFTRNGHDWTHRYPLIVEASLKDGTTSFVIDGEAVLLGVDGIADFNGLHSRQHDEEVQLYAFDILALGGDDLRKLPLHLRKNNLARLLARPDGIFASDFEQGEIGPELFRHIIQRMKQVARIDGAVHLAADAGRPRTVEFGSFLAKPQCRRPSSVTPLATSSASTFNSHLCCISFRAGSSSDSVINRR